MSSRTEISWCDSSFNPWIGCTKVSPGCDNCYAERDWDKRRHFVNWGAEQPRKRTSAANWKLPLRWAKAHFMECSKCHWRGEVDTLISDECGGCQSAYYLEPARRRVFCASLADVFDNEIPIEWLVDLLDLIRKTPNLDWLLLTKRIGRVTEALKAAGRCAQTHYNDDSLWQWIAALACGEPPAHVWLGASVVNQEEADRDIRKLLAVPARVRFLSMEPLLGAIDLSDHLSDCDGNLRGIHWVIVGGESGQNARPMHPAWVRSLRDQCQAAGVSFHFKQWGEWAPHKAVAGGDEGGDLRRGHVRYLQGDGREPDGHFRKGDAAVARVGRKAAGRLLGGRTLDEFPKVSA